MRLSLKFLPALEFWQGCIKDLLHSEPMWGKEVYGACWKKLQMYLMWTYFPRFFKHLRDQNKQTNTQRYSRRLYENNAIIFGSLQLLILSVPVLIHLCIILRQSPELRLSFLSYKVGITIALLLSSNLWQRHLVHDSNRDKRVESQWQVCQTMYLTSKIVVYKLSFIY